MAFIDKNNFFMKFKKININLKHVNYKIIVICNINNTIDYILLINRFNLLALESKCKIKFCFFYSDKKDIQTLREYLLKNDIEFSFILIDNNYIIKNLDFLADEFKKFDLLFSIKSTEYENIKPILKEKNILDNVIMNFYKNNSMGIISSPHQPDKLTDFIYKSNRVIDQCCYNFIKNFKLNNGAFIDYPEDETFFSKTDIIIELLKNNSYDKYRNYIIYILFYFAISIGYKWSRIDYIDFFNYDFELSSNQHRVNSNINNRYFKTLSNFFSNVNLNITDYNFSKHIKTLINSNLFDNLWYCKKYNIKNKNSILHYLLVGWKLGYSPSKSFDSVKYIITYPDVVKSNINPLIHYINNGQKEGRLCFRTSYISDYIEFFNKHLIDYNNKSLCFNFKCTKYKSNHKKIAIFAFFNKSLIINNSTVFFLSELKKVVDKIIFVSDCYLPIVEINKIADIIDVCISKKHNAYDFGSYKIGFNYYKNYLSNENIDEIIFCNDSCYGPFYSLDSFFKYMEDKKCDFYGMTHDISYAYYIQSYFFVLKKKVFNSKIFIDFIENIYPEKNQAFVILKYEIRMTQLLIKHGYIPFSLDILINKESKNLIFYPISSIENFSYFVKKKSLDIKYFQNNEGICETLLTLYKVNPSLFKEIIEEKNITISDILKSKNINFTIILPVFNRKNNIDVAINSILSQTYQNFELIIIDDCSTDGVIEYIKDTYNIFIKQKKIILLQNNSNKGVSYSRNKGLNAAKNDWICYIDSDNFIETNFLQIYRDAIFFNKNCNFFYSKFQNIYGKLIWGESFNYDKLIKYNFIDCGTIVHHRDLFIKNGGFDENLKRLVDWELAIKYTKNNTPFFINKVMLNYTNNPNDLSRITNKNNLDESIKYIQTKHSKKIKISTIILSYNQEKYIAQAIESALSQHGNFLHEIIIADDASNDKTSQIISNYTKKFPSLIKNLSSTQNRGISENYRYSIQHASGDYIAILEGDDYWNDIDKLKNQMDFLVNNSDCSMVFSKIKIFNEETSNFILLNRQLNLKDKLCAIDFLNNYFNLFGTFSTCMYRSDILKKIPSFLYNFRLSEIPLGFYFERYGKIGFINKVQTLYRQHKKSSWTGLSIKQKAISSYFVRLECILAISEENRIHLLEYLKNILPNIIKSSGKTKDELNDLFCKKLSNDLKNMLYNTIKNFNF